MTDEEALAEANTWGYSTIAEWLEALTDAYDDSLEDCEETFEEPFERGVQDYE